MLIIPAIDIIGGKCVRLLKGDFACKKIYSDDPVKTARSFEKQGAKMLHIVDLDGAKTGMPQNAELILKICKALKIPIEVGGGIRSVEACRLYLNAGIKRVVIGTKAVNDEAFLRRLLLEFGPDKIVVSIDIKDGNAATNAWEKTSAKSAAEFCVNLKNTGVLNVIVTDILRDGMLMEPNYEIVRSVGAIGFNVIAAGGVSSVASIVKLRKMGICGAILGKAIYEKKLNIADAIRAANSLSGLTKRIIPCLDVSNGRTVKGINFKNLKDAGDPVELGKKYSEEGADELVFLDITASQENRKTTVEMVEKVAKNVFIPFTVGGGVSTVDDFNSLLNAGADKIAINTAAVKNPQLIASAAEKFGSQCVVVAIDVKKTRGKYLVYIKGGSEATELEAVSWAKEAVRLGAGEILLTSMDCDGTKKGFDLEILSRVSRAVHVPVIASGGAGSLKDIEEAFTVGCADAALAASLFHYDEFSVADTKKYLLSRNIPVRI